MKKSNYKRNEEKRRRKLHRIVNKDHDYDFSFIYILINRKLKNICEYVESGDSYSDENYWALAWLKRAIKLSDFLITPINYPAHINPNNAYRFVNKGLADNIMGRHEPTQVNYQSELFKSEMAKLESVDRMYLEELYMAKARHLFFKIITNYIEWWWD